MSLTAETSREAYEFCLTHGLVGDLEAKVYGVLVQHGPMNQVMAWNFLNQLDPSLLRHSVTPRFASLKRKGLIREIEKRPCPFTGRATVFFEAVSGMDAARALLNAPAAAATLALTRQKYPGWLL